MPAAPPLLSIRLDDEELQGLMKQLSAAELRKVQISALSEMKRIGTKLVSDEVREATTLSVKYAKRAVSGTILKSAPPELTLRIRHRFTPAVAFKHTVSRRRGARVTYAPGYTQIWRHGFKSRAIGAFSSGVVSGSESPEGGSGAPGDGGHLGLWIRHKRISAAGDKGISHAKRPQDRTREQRLTPRGVAQRLPMRQIYGPSVFMILTYKGKLGKIGQAVFDKLIVKYRERVKSKLDAKLKGKF